MICQINETHYKRKKSHEEGVDIMIFIFTMGGFYGQRAPKLRDASGSLVHASFSFVLQFSRLPRESFRHRLLASSLFLVCTTRRWSCFVTLFTKESVDGPSFTVLLFLLLLLLLLLFFFLGGRFLFCSRTCSSLQKKYG